MRLEKLPEKLYVVGDLVFTTRHEARDALRAHRTLGDKVTTIKALQVNSTAVTVR